MYYVLVAVYGGLVNTVKVFADPDEAQEEAESLDFDPVSMDDIVIFSCTLGEDGTIYYRREE